MIDNEIKKLASIFDAMVDGVYVVDDDFNVEYMNEMMIKNFGSGIGKKCHQVVQKSDEPCHWCRAPEVFEGKSIRWEHHFSKLDKTFDVIEVLLKNSDGTLSKVGIFRDITQRKKSEARIRASEEDYRGLFENVGVGVYVSSKEGRFLNANKALLDMLGYESKEEFLKIDIVKDLYLNPEDRRKFQEMVERDGSVVDLEVEFKRKDGKGAQGSTRFPG
jgi:two-component system NtrC family sensor kinase